MKSTAAVLTVLVGLAAITWVAVLHSGELLLVSMAFGLAFIAHRRRSVLVSRLSDVSVSPLAVAVLFLVAIGVFALGAIQFNRPTSLVLPADPIEGELPDALAFDPDGSAAPEVTSSSALPSTTAAPRPPAVTPSSALPSTTAAPRPPAVAAASPSAPVTTAAPSAPTSVATDVFNSLEVDRHAELALDASNRRIASVETLRLTNDDLLLIYERSGRPINSLPERWRGIAIEFVLRDLDGWEISHETPQIVEMGTERLVSVGELSLVRGADLEMSVFQSVEIFSADSDPISLVAKPGSEVELRAPCHAVSSAAPVPDSDDCFGTEGEWIWKLAGEDLEVTATFVHPFLRSGAGNSWVNLTSGSFMSLVIVGPIGFLVSLAGAYLRTRILRRRESSDEESPRVTEPGLSIDTPELDIDALEDLLKQLRTRERRQRAIDLTNEAKQSAAEGS